LPVLVSIRNGPFRGVSRQIVRRWADRMLRCLDLAQAELSVAITDDREIRELNKVFRHRDRATDVLAFAMREGEPLGAPPHPRQRSSATAKTRHSTEMLGDVVVSAETARRQAKERRRTLDAEMRMLLAHGLLHLVGYDHRSDREETVMTAETDRLCRAAQPDVTAPSARRPSKSGARLRSSGSKNGTSTRGASRKAAR
jgi:probable rRNA maturation factor